MSVTIQLRRGTSTQWTLANPILAEGELGYETDTLAYKIGDGVSTWTALTYTPLTGSFASVLTNAYAAGTDPTPPGAGTMLIYSKDVAGRLMPKFQGPSGLDSIFQPAMFANGMLLITPSATTAFSFQGGPTFTAVGTVSTPTLAVGSLRSTTRRSIVTSAATANSASELRVAQTFCYRGDAPGLGGFFATFRFGCSSAVVGQRLIVGLLSSTAAISTSQSPSSLTSCVFMGNDSGDANMQIMYNDASGTCTKVNLGASFPPPNSTNNAIYELTLFAKANDTQIGWRAQRLDSPASVSGTITSDLVPSTTFLAPHLYCNNNGVASLVILDFYRLYIETDY